MKPITMKNPVSMMMAAVAGATGAGANLLSMVLVSAAVVTVVMPVVVVKRHSGGIAVKGRYS